MSNNLTDSQKNMLCLIAAMLVKQDSDEVLVEGKKQASLKRLAEKGMIAIKDLGRQGFLCKLEERGAKIISDDVSLLYEVTSIIGRSKLKKVESLGVKVPKMMLAA